MRKTLNFRLLILLIHSIFMIYCRDIKLAVSIPWSGGNWDAGKMFASATTLAVNAINEQENLLIGHNLTFVWGDSQCSESAALTTAVDMYTKQGPIDAFIGPACSDGCKVTGHLAKHWNIPIISYGCAGVELSVKDSFPTFARTVGVYAKSGMILVKLMKLYGWQHLAILTSSSSVWSSIAGGVSKDITNNKLSVTYSTNFDPTNLTVRKARDILSVAVEKSHIFLVGGYGKTIRTVLLAAKELDLIRSGFVFIVYELLPESCHDGDDILTNEKACSAYEGVLEIGLYVPQTIQYSNFTQRVRRAMEDPPFNHVMPAEEQVSVYAALLYDAVYAYALAINQTLYHNGSIENGTEVIRNIYNLSFSGYSGHVLIDDNGDRTTALQLRNLQNGSYIRVANFFGLTQVLEMMNSTIRWPGGSTKVPLGRPECGFNGEFCSEIETWVYAVAVASAVVLIFGVGVVAVFHYRRKAFERALLSQQWKIKFDEIQFRKKVNGFGSRRSITTTQDGSHLSLESAETDAVHGQIFTTIGIYGSSYVAIKHLRKSQVALARDVLLELKEACDLQHQNINTFVGACVDQPNICLLTQYCNKGSLQDVLYNESLKLDWMFQIAIAADIGRGMQYLHNSSIQVHGNLSSTKCVIDSRWVCKITDFGLSKFKSGQNKDVERSEDQSFTDLLWRAPEHLRESKTTHSQPGDIYSYGIILQEIILRGLPYCMFDNFTAKQIVGKVARGSVPPFRPMVSAQVGKPLYLELMRYCWDESPTARPRFDDVMKVMKKINGGKNINIVDNMISMMEKYTDHLEDLVTERTKQLEEEKGKTDELLYRMLPKSVAEQLKRGEQVAAESFAMVTIFFSDIVGFTRLAADSTPLQVVDLLNDLYTCFDQIVESHDVYKVETIGDAYMVVSGLPRRNGNRHAGEIAKMSLDLLSAMTTFTVRHLPDRKLQLRIGIHSGPCVAGVVGLKMPRYCLFGDTVNYASRMESSGLALRIHVSPETKEVLDDLTGYHVLERGPVSMKGKGVVTTYFLQGYDGFDKILPDLRTAASLEEHTFK